MNIQQLQYIVAVDQHRHFQKAADACFVTPATLSMMVKKLEQELDLTLFDRSKLPIATTEAGSVIVEKARNILFHIKDLKESAQQAQEDIAGEIRMAIIPTLAPYLGHLFLPKLLASYPHLKVRLYEWNTTQILEALRHDQLDLGIAATPLHAKDIQETPLFYERLMAYSSQIQHAKKEYISPAEIERDRLWLLEEDHCLRSQVIHLCSLRNKTGPEVQLDFEAGSIETLLNIVGINQGITVIPELVLPTLSEERKQQVIPFVEPQPVREISLLSYRHFMKEKLMQAVGKAIQEAVQPILTSSATNTNILDIELSRK